MRLCAPNFPKLHLDKHPFATQGYLKAIRELTQGGAAEPRKGDEVIMQVLGMIGELWCWQWR